MSRPNAWLELNADGVVINMIVWDGATPYTPESVSELLRCDDHPGVGYGWTRVDGGWQPPEEPIEE